MINYPDHGQSSLRESISIHLLIWRCRTTWVNPSGDETLVRQYVSFQYYSQTYYEWWADLALKKIFSLINILGQFHTERFNMSIWLHLLPTESSSDYVKLYSYVFLLSFFILYCSSLSRYDENTWIAFQFKIFIFSFALCSLLHDFRKNTEKYNKWHMASHKHIS